MIEGGYPCCVYFCRSVVGDLVIVESVVQNKYQCRTPAFQVKDAEENFQPPLCSKNNSKEENSVGCHLLLLLGPVLQN